MARNVEIKARVLDAARTSHLVAEMADRGPMTLYQTDTFFRVESGRLKLREFRDSEAELIYYERPNTSGPKESQYQRSSVSNADAMRNILTKTFGVLGSVRKKRIVFWVGRTRIHLDEVQDLGNFLELEVVLNSDESVEAGVLEARQLVERLEIEEASLLPDAYIDILQRDAQAGTT